MLKSVVSLAVLFIVVSEAHAKGIMSCLKAKIINLLVHY